MAFERRRSHRCRDAGRLFRAARCTEEEGGGPLPKHSENWVGEGEMRSAGETPAGIKAVLAGSGNAWRSHGW